MDEDSVSSHLAHVSIEDGPEDEAPTPAPFNLAPEENVVEEDGEAPTPDPFILLPAVNGSDVHDDDSKLYLPLSSDRRETRVVAIKTKPHY